MKQTEERTGLNTGRVSDHEDVHRNHRRDEASSKDNPGKNNPGKDNPTKENPPGHSHLGKENPDKGCSDKGCSDTGCSDKDTTSGGVADGGVANSNAGKDFSAIDNPVVMEPFDDCDVPGKPRRHPLWNDVSKKNWEDWHWQMQNAIRSVRQLRELLPFTPEELEAIGALEFEYKLAIPPYFFSLIDVNEPNDPIRLQSVTSPLESTSSFQLEDPLEEEKDSPVPGITHRYPDRVLMVTTHVCTMYCRFCTRKRATMVRGGWDAISRDDERMLDYIRTHPEIRDVIVSGGDPLTLPYNKLRYFLQNLREMKHVDVVRLGTRVPTTLPQKLFDAELIDILSDAEKVWIQSHFNHPREITPEVARACKNLLKVGIPINNHTVLLKNVNDNLGTMRSLMRALLRIKIRPYYLFHCDPVTGAGHFRTSVWKGLEMIEGLRGHMSGLAVPTYAIDSPYGGGKIPIMPNYLVSASDDCVILRNYEGMIVRYQAEDKPATIEPTPSTGVSELTQGTAQSIMPRSNERMARRRKNSKERPAKTAAAKSPPRECVPPDNPDSRRGRKRGRKPTREKFLAALPMVD